MIGQTLSHYQILEKLGEGGMGLVYKAHDLRLNRIVALKFLPHGDEASSERLLRFRTEAHAISTLNHFHIATIHDIEETDGQCFLVLEYMPGGTLRDKLLEKKGKGECFSFETVLDYACQIAEGLSHAHKQGIIHRDVKSDNVMLTSEGSLKITDFGLAKLEGGPRITKTGMTPGTISYMAPELHRGQAADLRSDIFSFGVVLYELLTGGLPFRGEGAPAIMHAILHSEPPPISLVRPEIPQALIDIVGKALQKDPGRRYQNLSDTLADLRRVASRYLVAQEDLSTISQVQIKSPLRKSSRQSAKALMMSLPVWLRVASGLALFFILLLSGWATLSLNLTQWVGWLWKKPPILLAIYPFENKTGIPEKDYSCAGLTSTLRFKLSEFQRVYPRLVIIPEIYLKDISQKDAHPLAGADFLLNGEVHSLDPDIQMTFRLIDARTKREVYSERIVTSSLGEVGLQAGLVRKILESMKFQFNPDAMLVAAAGSTKSLAPYKLYWQGIGYLNNKDIAGNLAKAIALFEMAIDSDSRFPLALVGKGEALFYKYYMEGRTDPGLIREARTFCEQALQIDRKLVRGHIVLGLIYNWTGRYDLAEMALEQAVQLDPRNSEANRNLAGLYQVIGKDKEAEATFRKAIELAPRAWTSYPDYAYYLYRRGRYREAQVQYEKVLSLVPDNLLALSDLAAMHAVLGEAETAREMYEKLVQVSPDPIFMSNLAQTLLYLGQYDRAIQFAEKAASLGSYDPEILGTLGDIYRWSPGYSAKAVAVFEKAILLTEKRLLVNPKEVEDCSNLAVYLAKTGRKERAIVEIQKAVQLDPLDVRSRGREAVVYEVCGQRAEALKALKEAIMLGFTIPEIKFEPEFRQLIKDARFSEIEKIEKSKPSSGR
jgi:eukaryotic-like serine/threonine-protein kinase